MSSARDHKIWIASERDVAMLGRFEQNGKAINFDGRRDCCSAPKCNDPMKFGVSYRYVTGRAGRIGRAEKGYCQAHGKKFAEKNGIDLPMTQSTTDQEA